MIRLSKKTHMAVLTTLISICVYGRPAFSELKVTILDIDTGKGVPSDVIHLTSSGEKIIASADESGVATVSSVTCSQGEKIVAEPTIPGY